MNTKGNHRGKKPRTIKIPVTADIEAENAYLEAQAALERESQRLLKTFNERLNIESQVQGTTAKELYDADKAALGVLEAAREAARDNFLAGLEFFEVGPIGFIGWQQLKRKYPSDSEPGFDVEAMAVELLSAALLTPKMDEEQVAALLENPDYSYGEIQILLQGAVNAQS